MSTLPAGLFRVCSRLMVATYGRWPVFGELRSAIAVVRNGDSYLLQNRSDRLGWAFPGGTSRFRETNEHTVLREVAEETGLVIHSLQPLLQYHDRHYVPSLITVFSAQAAGEPRGSWEGEAVWLPLARVRDRFFAPQRAILSYLDNHPLG